MFTIGVKNIPEHHAHLIKPGRLKKKCSYQTHTRRDDDFKCRI